MHLNCPRCRTGNEPDALFCKNCGTGFAVKQPRKSSIVLPLIIIGSILAVCGFCGLLGLLGSKNKNETVQSVNINAKSLVAAPLPDNKTVVNTASPVPPSPDDEQMATVIKDNANLRKTNSATGEVVDTLPKDSIIEVVRQSGAWFYVRAIGGRSGWLHGATIRLKNAPGAPPSVKSIAETYSAPRPTRPAITESSINNSGASAKCGDGTLSYSAHRRGTCSHHGGVAVWY